MPRMDEWEVFPRVAAAAGATAIEEGLARVTATREQLASGAAARILAAREQTRVLMDSGLIAAPPP